MRNDEYQFRFLFIVNKLVSAYRNNLLLIEPFQAAIAVTMIICKMAVL